ncbi:cadherin-related family member 5-like isoform X2 [Rana temporaria]|uniref:cadherin-related family member 5-like isoform X2 n=1 Tax=Rana temporaria TaxID=8407 RepID=UPI001AAE12CE|nr:cadherin-related family member 5-like isoform X2 [Rana temporaria]
MLPSAEILLLTVGLTFQMTSGDQCSSGSNIFTEILENSPNGTFVANLSMFGDPVTSTVKLCLSGTDADWFYLDGKNVWLNVSSGKTLDREAMNSSVLLVTLSCSEEGYPTVQYRIIVQVLNENDNKPTFLEESILPHNISELADIDSVVFTAKAVDRDGDTLMYVIDRTMGDYKYFHMDLPNNGKVLLSRPLDFESIQQLEVFIHAVEMTTRERQRTTVKVRVMVLDGDDQYPQFLPCNFMSHDGLSVCVSPTYLVNITTEKEPTGPLIFSPGPIFAEDGDKGIMAPISYSLLSGPDSEKFQIDNVTGSVFFTHTLESNLAPITFNLKVMASQVGDSRKYSLAEVLVRLLAANKHSPRFVVTQYQGFVQEDNNPAALVSTYNGRVLSVIPSDEDFPNGTNPQIHLSLASQSNHSQLFHITESGLLIARANQLKVMETYPLKIIARDEESGEIANCTVIVKVLAHGQAAPRDPSEPKAMFTLPDFPMIGAGLGFFGIVFGLLLFLLIRIVKNRRQQQQQMSQTSLVTEKHPSVVNTSKSSPQRAEKGYQNAAYSESPDDVKTCEEQDKGMSPSKQSKIKELGKADGNSSKQQKRTPAVAVISPGNQCHGSSPCKNKQQELSAEPLNRNQCTHQEATPTKELQSKKVAITQALVVTEEVDSSDQKPPLDDDLNSCIQAINDATTDASEQVSENQDTSEIWPEPPQLSRLPIVVEVNEEVTVRDRELNAQTPPMGSEIITPGSLMQLMEDSIEC